MNIFLGGQPKLGINVETKRRVVFAIQNKGNNEQTKQATFEETDIVTRVLEVFVSANTFRFFEIPGLALDFLFNLDPDNWVHDEGYMRLVQRR